jgi:hypothetical protein
MAASIKVFMKGEDKEKKIVGTPKVPKEMSKCFTKEDGTQLYYIDKDYGIKHGLMSKMDFRNPLVTNPDMCKITIKIERV